MLEELKVGCIKPLTESVEETKKEEKIEKSIEEGVISMIRVGRKAPDFVASAYYKGKFVNIKLSDYSGKWILLCFYPGDFTFV